LRAARDRVGQKIAEMKRRDAESFESVRREADSALHDLQVRIEQASDRYGAWDAARERRFNARVEEADAQLKTWNAQADAHRAEGQLQYQADLAALKQRVEVAKTKFKEWKARRDQQTQDALTTASRQLDATFQETAQKLKT
jgi:hypothetical protein